ncbi:MAG: LytR C-terminal domain-containing protein [Candidatus Shapirobacteria bacterium]
MKKILFALGIILVLFFWVKRSWRSNDFKLGIITPDRVALLSISPLRGMINLLVVNPNVELWIPEGMGWYSSDKIKKIYDNEKNTELMEKTFYYNFGFLPEKIAFFPNVDEWRSWSLVKYLGVIDWFRYLVSQDNWLYKKEVIDRSMELEKETLDETLPRDFADSELQSGEIKISVMNATNENGLGSFVADRLNWMGFNVVTVESEGSKPGCEIMIKTTANDLTKKYSDLLAKIYRCSQISNTTLLPDEAVLYLGQNYASMIKYSSYKK